LVAISAVAALTAAVTALLPRLAQAQDEHARDQQAPTGPTLKVTTEVVNVYAIVEDKKHHLISGLNKDDFQISEDGAPQQIKYFARETDTPLTMGLLVDTSPSQERVLPLEQQEAKSFLDQVLRPKDLVFVLHFDLDVELLQDFTAERRRLAKAIDETVINGGGAGGGRGVTAPTTFPTTDSACCTQLYDAVYLASHDMMSGEIGRKVEILLTDGVDAGSKLKLEQALESAQKANVIIYSIDISDRMFYHHGFGSFGFGDNGESVLHKLSQETGGRVIVVNHPKDTGTAFQQIAEELRTQYLIGYTPTNSRHDGTFRKIQVSLKTNPEYRAQARRGYYAPLGD
jgi:VWFA-related protein